MPQLSRRATFLLLALSVLGQLLGAIGYAWAETAIANAVAQTLPGLRPPMRADLSHAVFSTAFHRLHLGATILGFAGPVVAARGLKATWLALAVLLTVLTWPLAIVAGARFTT